MNQAMHSKAVLANIIFIEPKVLSGKLGGAKRDRTADLLHAMQALSQLSYSPKPKSLDKPDIGFRRVITKPKRCCRRIKSSRAPFQA
jgi:hypothetical protein